MAFNPLIWKGFDLKDKTHEQLFMSQLADLLNALNSAQGLANLLNGQGTLGTTALTNLAFSQVISGNTTISLANVARATIVLSLNTVVSPTVLNLTNLAQGTDVQIRFTNTSGSAVVFAIAAFDPSGAAYAVVAFGVGAALNMVASGVSVPTNTNYMFRGNTAGLDLEFLAIKSP